MAEKEVQPQGLDPVQKGIGDLSRRLRVLEERYVVLRRKGQLTEENLMSDIKDVREEVEKTRQEALELRRLMADIDDKLDRFLEQVKTAAPRQDVLVLKKYLEMWDPIQYVTRDEVRRAVQKD